MTNPAIVGAPDAARTALPQPLGNDATTTHSSDTKREVTGTSKKKKRGRRPKFTPNQVIAALEAAHGIKLAAALMLACSVATIGNYAKRHTEVRDALGRILAASKNPQ